MKIRHVYGNVLKLDIPLTIKIRTIEDGTPSEREEPFYPDATKECIVELANNYNRKIEYEATIKDNIVHIEDIGNISIGRYKITVKCYDADGNPYRYMARDIVEICDATADAGIEAGVEFNAETYTLEGAVFISYGGGSFEQVQADWNEDDSNSKAYIKNKPTIPAEVTESTVAGWGFTKNTGTYSKPSGGIPSTDMSSAVQTSLGKADTALQTETDPTVPSWAKQSSKPSYTASEVGAVPTTRTVNGKVLSSNISLDASDVGALPDDTPIPVVPTNVSAFTNDAGYLTSHQDISGKEDKVDIVAASGSTLTAEVGKYYTLSNVGTLAITLPTIPTGTTKVQTVAFYVAAGSSPVVTFTSTHPVYYSDGFEVTADSTYEVNALWNGIAWIVASVNIIVE